jgi:hypothetical protein
MMRSTTSIIDQVRKATMVFVAYLCLQVRSKVICADKSICLDDWRAAKL